ncbi:Endoribonuclease EndoA [bioreactor metagenome]|uniref:Endoribonuclease EndoA n=1 Tax=bioreactor metagenome TaxID=1076179 RepID=A0A645AD06_9ZZZZ
MRLYAGMNQGLRSVNNVIVKRGDIFYADLSPVVGSEQGGVRPVLVIQNDIGNKYSPTIIVAAITSQINKAKLPTHIEISAEEYGLTKDSVILLEQIRTIDKKRLKERIGHLSDELMKRVDECIQISFGLADYTI